MPRKRRLKKQLRFSPKFFLIFFFASIALLVLFTSITIPHKASPPTFFAITHVDTGPTMSESLKKDIMRMVKGVPLFSFDIQSARRKLMDAHLEVKELNIIKKFPATLKIEIQKRTPLFQLKDKAYFIVGEDFKVIDTQSYPQENLVIVEAGSINRNIKKGITLRDARIIKAGKLIVTLNKFDNFAPEIILAHNEESISFITHDTTIILGDGDFERKLNILNSLLREKFNNDFSRLRYVDLRYSKVYIGKKR